MDHIIAVFSFKDTNTPLFGFLMMLSLKGRVDIVKKCRIFII